MTTTTGTTEIVDRVRSLVADSGLTEAEFAAEAKIDPEDFAQDLSTSQFSSLDIALIADFAGRDPMWVISGQWPMDQLHDFARRYRTEMDIDLRMGANAAMNALHPFLPADVWDVLCANEPGQAAS